MGDEAAMVESFGKVARRDLLLSMGGLALIIVLALGRIALDGNWQKVLRVSLAFLVYAAALLVLAKARARLTAAASAPLPFWIFALAGAAAELSSGWLRPDWRLSDLLGMPFAAALLIGGFHWLVLRAWRPLRERIVTGRATGRANLR
jgi:hypothetical protein